MILRITFLGTSGTTPTVERNPSAILLNFRGERILFDCGEGTQRQMMRAKTGFRNLNNIFITHFHTDHFIGLFGLIETMSLNERKDKLTIYTPRGGKKLIDVFNEMGYFRLDFEIEVIELKNGDSVNGEGYRIECAEVKHNIPCLAYAFVEKNRPGKFNRDRAISLGIPPGPLFKKLQMGEPVIIDGKKILPEEVVGPERKGRKVVYSGDTRPCDAVVDLSRDADLLIHESAFGEDLRERAIETFHSTSLEAGEIARKANVKRLVLTHISPRYDRGDVLISDAKKVFPDVIVAEDLMTLDIKYRD